MAYKLIDIIMISCHLTGVFHCSVHCFLSHWPYDSHQMCRVWSGMCIATYAQCFRCKPALVVVVYPLPWPLLVGESDLFECGPPASFSVLLASSSVTPTGSVHKSGVDNVVRRWVQLKRWCVLCMWVLQRGIVVMDVIWCRLCLSMILERVKYLFRTANVWWWCAKYFVIASCD